MEFKTPVNILKVNDTIDLSDSIFTMGSCFSDSIGSKLEENKFNVSSNPFGTIYDPLSINRLLLYSINDQMPDEFTYIQNEGVFRNLMLHSSFSGIDKDELVLKIRGNLATAKKHLVSSKWLIITYGTAFVYKYLASNKNVANCQKLPSDNFAKELKSVKQLMTDFDALYQQINSFNPDLKIIVTVSPVRHLRDGISGNSVSKSILRILCNELTKTYSNVHYYPSFEIVMDDLRDYRYYNSDMIHPTNQAIDYIWEHFIESFINDKTRDFITKWNKIRLALNHKPFNPNTNKHQKFLKKTLEDLSSISSIVNVDKEIDAVEKQII